MGDSGLRCQTCLGKFGPVVGELRCALCSLLARYQTLLLSDRFPAAGGEFALPELQSAYHRALEVAESYHQYRGGAGPPGNSEGSAPGVGGHDLQTTPKAKPPVKGEEEKESVPIKTEKEESSPREPRQEKSPLPRKEGEPRKERKSRPQDPPRSSRARRSGIRRRDRSRSPLDRRRDPLPRRGDSRGRRRSPQSGEEGLLSLLEDERSDKDRGEDHP